MTGSTINFVLMLLLGAATPLAAALDPAAPGDLACRSRDFATLGRNPTAGELRCRFGISGPGRFGLLSYVDVPVYQPDTPMPGTHIVGLPGHARPHIGESFEEWEWRVLRTDYGVEVHEVHRGLEELDPRLATRILELERRLAGEGLHAVRRETWRSPRRQAYLFQQGRSRPGPLATATLTSWHAQVDGHGNPAGRAVDYDVRSSDLPRFHEIAQDVGLHTFGADSHDPWHVFLPGDELPRQEIVLLRTLPRVPEVTLATGLPVDQALPTGGRDALRMEATEFAALRFIPFPSAQIATGHALAIRTWLRWSGEAAVALANDSFNRAEEWMRSADGDGRGERPRSAGSEGAGAARNRGD